MTQDFTNDSGLHSSSLCSVDGGELFDRIIDDNYNLTEFDTILFIKQICEGIRYMHQMYILHLDLKVEHGLYPNLHPCVDQRMLSDTIHQLGKLRESLGTYSGVNKNLDS